VILYKVMAQEKGKQSQGQSPKPSKKKDPLRPILLMQSALEKKTPVDIKLMSGEVMKDAIILHIEVYEITILHEGNIVILWKHAIEKMTFKPQK